MKTSYLVLVVAAGWLLVSGCAAPGGAGEEPASVTRVVNLPRDVTAEQVTQASLAAAKEIGLPAPCTVDNSSGVVSYTDSARSLTAESTVMNNRQVQILVVIPVKQTANSLADDFANHLESHLKSP
jgi:uncharacterized lipoprotein YbaY